MTLSDNSEYLSQLIDAGRDAMTNLYYLKFTGIGGDSNISLSMTVRAGDFQAPKPEQGNHTVNFLTVDALMPTAEIKMDKQFDITFRVDENYKIYDYLLTLQGRTSRPSVGYVVTNSAAADERLGLEVYAPMPGGASITSQGLPENWVKLHEFKYMWVKKITPPKFSYDNPGAVTVTATFGFFTCKDFTRNSKTLKGGQGEE